MKPPKWIRGVSIFVIQLAASIVSLAASSNEPANQHESQQNLSSTASQSPNYLETGRKITAILDRFMSLGYDKRVRPNYGGPPVEVNVTMRILSISSVSEVLMDFTADFYFRQTWHDPRLAFTKLNDIKTLYVGAEVSKKIWLPDTFFGNEKMAYFHEATTPNVFLRIDHSGEVYRSIRLTVTSSCPMNLQYFPMDRQRCTIEAESYGYNVRDIKYRWARKETAVERDEQISLPQFDIVRTVQKYRLEELSSGTYSRLIAELHFARRMGYYLIQIYIPSSLIVVISWVSFWLHRNASPARVQLGVTTVLTMTTLMSSTNAALPKISYIKSIDIFLGTCFIMVFAALLEYATVGYLGKRIAMRKAQLQHAQSQNQAKTFAQLQAQCAQGEMIPLVSSANMNMNLNMNMNEESPSTVAANLHMGNPTQIFSDTAPEVPGRYRCSASHFHPKSSHIPGANLLGHFQPETLSPSSLCAHDIPMNITREHNHHHHHHHRNQSSAIESSRRNRNDECCHNHNHNHNCQYNHDQDYNYHNHYQSRLYGTQTLPKGVVLGNCCSQSGASANEADRRQHLDCVCLSGFQASLPNLSKNHCPCHGSQPELQAPPTNHLSGRKKPMSLRAPLAATAAAASFVNLHRKSKGLPPSTNPNLVSSFNWINNPPMGKGVETIFGVRPSDIDKYSRVVFPVCFVCFQLMYWIVYLHISALLESDQNNPPG